MIVKVPRTPKRAFNMERRPSKLLLDQIAHLEWAVLPAFQRTPAKVRRHPKAKTEAQAAERIGQLTKMILDAKDTPKASADQPRPRVELPPLPRTPGRKPKPRKSRPRKGKSGKITSRKASAPSKRRAAGRRTPRR